MPTMTVALLQLESPGAATERALRDGETACREAAALGADVALFPEMWQIGYTLPPPEARATPTDGPFVTHPPRPPPRSSPPPARWRASSRWRSSSPPSSAGTAPRATPPR